LRHENFFKIKNPSKLISQSLKTKYHYLCTSAPKINWCLVRPLRLLLRTPTNPKKFSKSNFELQFFKKQILTHFNSNICWKAIFDAFDEIIATSGRYNEKWIGGFRSHHALFWGALVLNYNSKIYLVKTILLRFSWKF